MFVGLVVVVFVGVVLNIDVDVLVVGALVVVVDRVVDATSVVVLSPDETEVVVLDNEGDVDEVTIGAFL